MNKPAIVVIAFNREKSLQRLLNSISKADYPTDDIVLHISIDASENECVKEVADQFEWQFGDKIVELKSSNLGLLKHVLECGSLTQKYGSIVVLEDDLVVAPNFYNYAVEATDYYAEDDKIAGVSLFTYPVEENNFFPFQPIRDNSDVHFIQVASSWGQSWTKNQWSHFRTWLIANPGGIESLLPGYVLEWGNNSWKKLFISYMIATDRYFVFPNTSYSSNFEDKGTHVSQTGLFQVSLNFGSSRPRFNSFSDSNSIYDVYFELIPEALKRIAPQFSAFDFEIDLYGVKPIDPKTSPYLITIKNGKLPVKSYAAAMTPLIQNVIFEIEGNDIHLLKTANVLANNEDPSFLEISESIVKLRQNAHAFSANDQQVTIVIPARDEGQLQFTFDNLYKDRFHSVTVLICCSVELSRKFESMEEILGCRVKWAHSESTNLSELLRQGFNACTTGYVSWVQAGMEINLKKFEQVAKVFSGMKQVNFLKGIDEDVCEKNYLTKNSAPYRVTAELLTSISERNRDVSSELTVWRTSMLDEIESNLKPDLSNLFIELLKVTPLYIFVDQIGSRNGMHSLHSMSRSDVKECLSHPKFKRNRVIRMLARPFFWHFFYLNVPFFRLFYKEIERFPMVIRYDFKNDSFYLDNY